MLCSPYEMTVLGVTWRHFPPSWTLGLMPLPPGSSKLAAFQALGAEGLGGQPVTAVTSLAAVCARCGRVVVRSKETRRVSSTSDGI